MKRKNIFLTVDIVLLAVNGKKTEVLLIQRKNHPFKNKWALPGGFVDYGEVRKKTARRELKEETGVSTGNLIEIGVFDDPKRDPRGHIVSTAYLAVVKNKKIKVRAGDDAKKAKLFLIKNLPPLAFDHAKIIKKALDYLKYPSTKAQK